MAARCQHGILLPAPPAYSSLSLPSPVRGTLCVLCDPCPWISAREEQISAAFAAPRLAPSRRLILSNSVQALPTYLPSVCTHPSPGLRLADGAPYDERSV